MEFVSTLGKKKCIMYNTYNTFFLLKDSLSIVHCVVHYCICRSTGIILLLFIRCLIISTMPTTNIRYVYQKMRNISIVSKTISSGRFTSNILKYSYCRSTSKSRQSAVQALPPFKHFQRRSRRRRSSAASQLISLPKTT